LDADRHRREKREEGREKRGWDDGGLGYLAIKLSGNRAIE